MPPSRGFGQNIVPTALVTMSKLASANEANSASPSTHMTSTPPRGGESLRTRAALEQRGGDVEARDVGARERRRDGHVALRRRRRPAPADRGRSRARRRASDRNARSGAQRPRCSRRTSQMVRAICCAGVRSVNVLMCVLLSHGRAVLPGVIQDARGRGGRGTSAGSPYSPAAIAVAMFEPSPERGLGGFRPTGVRWLQEQTPAPAERRLHRFTFIAAGSQPAGFCLSAFARLQAPREDQEGPEMRSILTLAGLIVALACPAAASAVVGGKVVKPGAYPFAAAIGDAKASYYCGGTLIAPGVILTAAHCLTERRVALSDLRVLVGSGQRGGRDRGRPPPEVRRAVPALRRRAADPRPRGDRRADAAHGRPPRRSPARP